MTKPIQSTFDGTLGSLIECYRTDSRSAYQTVRHRTRVNYDGLYRRIARDHGTTQIIEITPSVIRQWHFEWKGPSGQTSAAHSRISALRRLAAFGISVLNNPECHLLGVVLTNFRAEKGKARTEVMTAEYVKNFCEKAHQRGQHSLALAQVIQFACRLRQTDVAGEWVPIAEPGDTGLISGNLKWVRGMRWSNIDENCILRHRRARDGKPIEVNLSGYPMVMQELRRFSGDMGDEPLIINEATGLPYLSHQFRRAWRIIATAAGIPNTIRNTDSKPTLADKRSVVAYNELLQSCRDAFTRIAAKEECDTVDLMAAVASDALALLDAAALSEARPA